jgi:tRNA A37 methylthiotransferase MiaB
MAKIWVEAYGCSASFADSEMISGLIVNGGHTLVQDKSEQVTIRLRSDSDLSCTSV